MNNPGELTLKEIDDSPSKGDTINLLRKGEFNEADKIVELLETYKARLLFEIEQNSSVLNFLATKLQFLQKGIFKELDSLKSFIFLVLKVDNIEQFGKLNSINNSNCCLEQTLLQFNKLNELWSAFPEVKTKIEAQLKTAHPDKIKEVDTFLVNVESLETDDSLTTEDLAIIFEVMKEFFEELKNTKTT